MTQKYNGSAWVDCADRALKTATATATIYPATLRTAQSGSVNYQVYGKTETVGGVDTGVGEPCGSGEPQGYKIPLSLSDGTVTTDYPIYIGNSQLMGEEYVDSETGKMYKLSSNIWNGNCEAWNTNARVNVIDNGDGSFSVSKTSSQSGAYPAVKIGQEIETGKKYMMTFTISGMTQAMLSTYPVGCLRNISNNQTKSGGTINITGDGTYKTPVISVEAGRYAFCILFVQNDASVTFSDVVVSDISIQELTAQDPPAPFPEITLSAGDNDVSFSTTVLPAEFDATFEGWHDVTEKVWDGVEWTEV